MNLETIHSTDISCRQVRPYKTGREVTSHSLGGRRRSLAILLGGGGH